MVSDAGCLCALAEEQRLESTEREGSLWKSFTKVYNTNTLLCFLDFMTVVVFAT